MAQRAARLAQARAALAAAETKAGVRSMAYRRRDHHLIMGAAEVSSVGSFSSVLSRRGGALPASREVELSSPWQSLCRSLDLGEGGALSLSGSMQLLFYAAARAQGAQGWCAFLGSDYVGWLAAQEAGLALERTLSIPLAEVFQGRERAEYAPLLTRVLAGLLDGVDVVVVSAAASAVIPPAARRRFAARARERHVTLLLAECWQGHPSFQAWGQWRHEEAGEETQEMPAGYLQDLRWKVGHERTHRWSHLTYTPYRGLQEVLDESPSSVPRARGHLRLVTGQAS